MNLRRLLVAISLLLGTLAVLAPPASASGLVGGYRIGATPSCVQTGGVLTALGTPGIAVRMRPAWASGYTSQYVRVSSRLQGQTSGSWVTLSTDGARRSRTVKVPRSYVQRYLSVSLSPLRVPSTGQDHYRAAVRIDWYSPKTGRIEGTVTRTTASSCVAAATPRGTQNLKTVGTGTANQVKATYDVLGAVQSQVVQCSPACSTTTGVPAGGGAALTSLATSSSFADGTPATLSLRTCLAPHPTICSPWAAASTVPFGPIGAATITATASGNNVTATAHVDPNGAAVTMMVRNTSTGATTSCGTGNVAGQATCVLTNNGLAYSTTFGFQVVVSDASGHFRPATSASTSATTAPDPSGRSVTVYHGGSAVGQSGCTSDPTCTYIGATLSGFSGTVTCLISNATWPGGTGGFITWTAGNGSKQSPDYAGWRNRGYTVTVTCGGISSPPFPW